MSADFVRHSPSVEALDELAKALVKFVWHDESSSYLHPWAQERHRLPGFVGVVEAMRPLRDLKETVGWTDSLPGLVNAIIKTFDVLAYSWGWGELLKPADHRDAYIKRCEEKFRDSYLLPIQEAAKTCRKNLSVIDCPAFVEELCEMVPSIKIDIIKLGNDLVPLKPLYEAFDQKRNAFLFGESYPKLSDVGRTDTDPTADIALGGTLKAATQKLTQIVGKAKAGPNPPGPVTVNSATFDYLTPRAYSIRTIRRSRCRKATRKSPRKRSNPPNPSKLLRPVVKQATGRQGHLSPPTSKKKFYEPLRGLTPRIAWFVYDESTHIFKGPSKKFGSFYGFWREVLCRTQDGIWIRFEETADGPWQHTGQAHPYWQVTLKQVAEWFSTNSEPPPEILFEDIKQELCQEVPLNPTGQAQPDVREGRPKPSSVSDRAAGSKGSVPARSTIRSKSINVSQKLPGSNPKGPRVDPWLVTSLAAAIVTMLAMALILYWPTWKVTWILIVGATAFIFMMFSSS